MNIVRLGLVLLASGCAASVADERDATLAEAAATTLRGTLEVPSSLWSQVSDDCRVLPAESLPPEAGYLVQQAHGAPDLAVVFGPDGEMLCVDSIEALLEGYRFTSRADGGIALVSVDWRALVDSGAMLGGDDVRSLGGGDPEPQPMDPEDPLAPVVGDRDPSDLPFEPDGAPGDGAGGQTLGVEDRAPGVERVGRGGASPAPIVAGSAFGGEDEPGEGARPSELRSLPGLPGAPSGEPHRRSDTPTR